jgi:hypothetical protein
MQRTRKKQLIGFDARALRSSTRQLPAIAAMASWSNSQVSLMLCGRLYRFESLTSQEAALRLSVGVQVSDVIVEPDGDLLGEGGNRGARLQAIADPARFACLKSISSPPQRDFRSDCRPRRYSPEEYPHPVQVSHCKAALRLSATGAHAQGVKQQKDQRKKTNMNLFRQKELYASPNGDRWTLAQDVDGKLVVRHQPNRASGGIASEIPLDVFLAHGGQGPEHQALSTALAELSNKDTGPDAEISEQVDRVLGQAVLTCWNKLTPEVQAILFEAAVQAEGETIRQTLAMYLHDRHDRTVQSVQAKAMPEPDSLGG